MSEADEPRRNPPGQQFGGDLLTQIFAESMDPGYAEATGRGRRRRPAAYVGMLVSMLLIGLLLAVAYNKVVTDEPAATTARAKLVSDVRRNQADADKLQTETENLREEVSVQRDKALTDAGGDAGRLRDLAAHTGLAKVTGAGAQVTIADAPGAVDPVTGRAKPSGYGKVYDRDLQKIVNALWSAGAEAVSINEQRLSSTSTIRAAGGAILVDFRPVSSPYKISAIGPDDLDTAFNRTNAARQFKGYVEQYGMQFSVKRVKSLTLPAAGDPQLRYARPVPSASPTPPVSPTPTGGGR